MAKLSFILLGAVLLGANSFSCTLNKLSVSDGKVVNSKKSFNPAVVPILRTGGREYCTGSLINKVMAITAQHCIDPEKSGCGVTIHGKTPTKCFIDKKFQKDRFDATNAIHDFAVLVFSAEDSFQIPGQGRDRYLRFGLGSGPDHLFEKQVEVIGYGRTDWAGHEEERRQRKISGGRGVGISGGRGAGISGGRGAGIAGEAMEFSEPQHSCRNKISAVDSDGRGSNYGLIHFYANNRKTNACLPTFGDSGGPLIYHEQDTGRQYIVGLASTVFYPDDGLLEAVYVAMFSNVAMEVLEFAVDSVTQEVLDKMNE
jgi:hypothetical protein